MVPQGLRSEQTMTLWTFLKNRAGVPHQNVSRKKRTGIARTWSAVFFHVLCKHRRARLQNLDARIVLEMLAWIVELRTVVSALLLKAYEILNVTSMLYSINLIWCRFWLHLRVVFVVLAPTSPRLLPFLVRIRRSHSFMPFALPSRDLGTDDVFYIVCQ